MQAIASLRRGEPIQGFINAMLLRSLKQAGYAEVDKGHFGLAMQGYAHFTSPIRRYADLIIHRLLKLALKGKLSERERTRWDKYLKHAAAEISARERATNNAMYEVSAAKLAEYMEGHLGESFDGIVVNIMNFGVFINLVDPPCDGLVPIDTLGPKVKIDEGRELKYGKQTIRLGDAVRVQLTRVDRERGLIDLALI
ncbi:MAG: Ribonuclease R [Deltaproteobacteria bacterium ADurb.Bin510]|nr:MAG: Ribonuclease R [Deltaproteobacteria bacterium ADurb.Bin510]